MLGEWLLLLALASAVGAVVAMFCIDTGLGLDEYGRIVLFTGGMTPLFHVEWPREGIIATLRRRRDR
jgi:hypothetical protein